MTLRGAPHPTRAGSSPSLPGARHARTRSPSAGSQPSGESVWTTATRRYGIHLSPTPVWSRSARTTRGCSSAVNPNRVSLPARHRGQPPGPSWTSAQTSLALPAASPGDAAPVAPNRAGGHVSDTLAVKRLFSGPLPRLTQQASFRDNHDMPDRHPDEPPHMVAGMDGNRTHLGRFSAAPQTVLKPEGRSSTVGCRRPS
jgi:hypothetical protein